ncbi:hypothetical protein [Phaeodactylibacter xiamenensis]|uniref:hypothetical protein n=1 Tax=Phaeodactylibacter xiamenensis TaxID=1524460 RepID=UPI0024A90C6D|nr:hypothetical protein [Phaeodactylibacter xiamenensis]
MKIQDFFAYSSTKLGFSGAALYWFFENHEVVLGAVLSVCMIVSSIAYHAYKVVAIRNDERRKEERHRQELLQDQERHNRDLNNQ